MSDAPVLIVGAGPTGLMLALWLTRAGVSVRIVDAAAGPGTTSRALVMHARNLEFYRQLGIADRALAQGTTFEAANLWVRGRHVARVALGALGAGLSRYPFVLIIGQDVQERLLVAALDSLGVRVERNVTIEGLDVNAGGAVATLQHADGRSERCTARWVAGCDGAHSATRKAIGTGFPGGTYSSVYYVADVVATGATANGEFHVALDDADFLAAFPMPGPGHARFIGQVRPGSGDDVPRGWADVDTAVMERLDVAVQEVRWFSTYRVHHRVAESFRRGPVFLLGDAAHIHSPVGGQGMNTGLGDAVNLAWKLAAVVQGRADESILDSYEPERMAFARRLVATTDRAFALVTSSGRVARFVRTRITPVILPLFFRVRALRRLAFRTISQTAIRYPDSPLSAGKAGGVRGGDRLPWLADAHEGDNYAPLASRDWQVHVYGHCPQALRTLCDSRGLALHVFPWRPVMRTVGFAENAAYLLRPDGYVALASGTADAGALAAYLDRHGIR